MLEIEQYNTKYINDAVEIWNDIVEDGIAFPQMDLLDPQTGDEFFKSARLWGCTFSTRTMSGAAGIFRMRAMRSRKTSAASTSVNFS